MKKTISIILGIAAGIGAGTFLGMKLTKGTRETYKTYSEKHLAILELFDQWMFCKQNGKSVEAYLKKSNMKTVAIYGMGHLGKCLYEELKDTDICVKYVIDQKADELYTDVDKYLPEDHLPEVDLIIVTAIYNYGEIEKLLSDLTEYPIMSLEDILYDM